MIKIGDRVQIYSEVRSRYHLEYGRVTDLSTTAAKVKLERIPNPISFYLSELAVRNIKKYSNEYGSLVVDMLEGFKPIADIKRPDDVFLFSLKDAEKIVLITENKDSQIVVCFPFDGKCYFVLYNGCKEGAICIVTIEEFKCDLSPSDEIDRIYKETLQ